MASTAKASPFELACPMPLNKAAYLPSVGARLEVKEAPYTPPGSKQVTIKNYACAVNPCDWIQQDTGLFITEWPYILGCDVAGTVEDVGPDVHYLKPGDRVLAISAAIQSTGTEGGGPQMKRIEGGGGFQSYSVVYAKGVAKLPNNVSFEQGCVVPLGLVAAASALYLPSCLGLEYPSVGTQQSDAYIFVWGGSSSVGSSGVQLAVSSGFRVLTTCSSRNIPYCQSLGAEKAFDYNENTVVDDITEYLKGKRLAGVLHVVPSEDAMKGCVQIAQRCEGAATVMTIIPGCEKGHPEDARVALVKEQLKDDEALEKILRNFLPDALQKGTFKAKPDPQIAGKGLEHAQKACDTVKAGVSATKVVILL
ncbi:MAG: hypothetical protein Q9165_004870 [Trypethelium subeluteriae]